MFILRKKIKMRSPRCVFKGRTYRGYNKEVLLNRLSQYPLDEFYRLEDVNDCWNIFIDRITEILNDICPVKSFSFNKEKQPWINQELLTQIANRDEAIKTAKRTGSPDDLVYARKIRNQTKTLLNKAKSDYYINQLDENRNDPKKFWQHIFTVLNKNKSDNILNLEDDNGDMLDQKDVPDFINEFFTTIGAKLVSDNPKMKQNFSIPEVDRNAELFYLHEINMFQLMPLINQIKIYKSSGIENISSKVFKDALLILNNQAMFMINLSIRSCKFPDAWKKGTVIPLPRVNNPKKVGDLRPITLLPIPSKIIEKVVYSQLMYYLENNNYIHGNQYGFRKK